MGKRILAIASGGGHWHQLMAMRPAFEGHRVTYVTTLEGLPEQAGLKDGHIVPDCNRDSKVALMRTAVALTGLMVRTRPQVVISTGALPGVIALGLGKTMRARTIWIDSVANAGRMSLSGRLARRVADLWLTQWEHLAEATGAEYAGSVL